MTESKIYPVNLLVHWQMGEAEPWLALRAVATNLPDGRLELQAYGRKMWTEEMFGDLKGHTCTALRPSTCGCVAWAGVGAVQV